MHNEKMRQRTGSRIGFWMAGAAVALAMGGCAIGPRMIQTEVTTFNEWATLPADRTYTFTRTLEYRNSLELKSYEDIVRDELATRGFKLVADPAQANLVVMLRPSVTTISVVGRDLWPAIDPFWGPYGGYYGRRFGGFGPGFGGFYGGPYGVEDFGTYRQDIYRKRLELDIDSRTVSDKRYYEGRVENTAYNASLAQVMPVLVHALFTDFPGNNGQTRRVDVPVEPRQ
jgi:hypothetical protein